MKLSGKLAIVASLLLGSQAFAIPSFTDLATAANNSGGDFIDIDSFNHTAIANDAFWSKQPGAAVKFKAEISGYNNAMGYANLDGTGQQIVLNEGQSGWVSIDAAPDPFVFLLDTGKGHQWFSDDSLNKDGMDHLLVFQKNDGSDRFILFWDDQNGGGDRDFNDFVARVDFISPAQVPEPGALALLGMGLMGLGLSRRKTKA